MKKRFLCTILFLGSIASLIADEASLAASFKMVSIKYSNGEPIIISDSLHYTEFGSGDDIAFPFLIKTENKIGIYDYLAKRLVLLDENLQKESIVSFEAEGDLQSDGYRVKASAESIAIYKYSREPESQIVVKLPNTSRPFFGGVWYQADTLFFYDQTSILYVIEHPILSDQDNYNPNTMKNIRDENYIKNLLSYDKTGKYLDLSWSEQYRLTRNGYPVTKIFNRDWQQFHADKRKESGIVPNEKNQLIPPNWLNAMNLIDIANDGTLYWGGANSIFITQKGFLIRTVKWDKSAWGPIITQNGDILLQSESPSQNRFDIYKISRNW